MDTVSTMHRHLIAIILAASLASSAFSQDDSAEGGEAADPESAAVTSDEAELEVDAELNDEADDESDDESEDEEIDDADLDDESYEEDEDDFIPSEEIPVDEPIPFPTNI
jgi:hypothetical protein